MLSKGVVLLESERFDSIVDALESQQEDIALQKLMVFSVSEEMRFWEYFKEKVKRNYNDIENIHDYIDELELIFLIDNLRLMGKILHAKQISSEQISERFNLIASRSAKPDNAIKAPPIVNSYHRVQSDRSPLIPVGFVKGNEYIAINDDNSEDFKEDGESICCTLF